MNGIGVVAACATFFGIWLGHVTVRKVEYIAPDIRIPTILAIIIGLTLEAAALASGDAALSGTFGILSMTVLFDAIEFTRQYRRVKNGHAPANPNNPRHAMLLAEGQATTIDRPDRDPVGRSVGADEALNLLNEDYA